MPRSTPGGGSERERAVCLSIGIVESGSDSGREREAWRALRCSVSWKAESICCAVVSPGDSCVCWIGSNTPRADLRVVALHACLLTSYRAVSSGKQLGRCLISCGLSGNPRTRSRSVRLVRSGLLPWEADWVVVASWLVIEP